MIGNIEEYRFKFIGEPGYDVGGLRREYMRLLSVQVMDVMGLFIPSPNSTFNMAVERDKCVPNPKFATPSELEVYRILGLVMAMIYKSGGVINLDLPSIFWKYMLTG